MYLRIQKDVRQIKLISMWFIAAAVIMIGQAIAQAIDRSVQVDSDVWEFLKYIGVLFAGALLWQGKRFVDAVDRLTKTVQKLEDNSEYISEQITEIKKNLIEHDRKIDAIEARKDK